MKDLALLEVVIIELILVALLLFGLLWALKTLLRNTPIRKSIKTRLDRVLPLIEGIVWLGFMLWCIGRLVENDLWNSIGMVTVLLFVVVLLFWFVVRDYLAGIILKTDGSLKLNDWIKVKGIEGKITDLGHRTMIVTTDSGETISVPYATISGEISSRPNPSEKLINHSFELKVSKQTDAESTINQIRSTLLNAPWSSVKKIPEIKLLGDHSSYYHFEINIFSIRMVYFQKIKDYLMASPSFKDFEVLGN